MPQLDFGIVAADFALTLIIYWIIFLYFGGFVLPRVRNIIVYRTYRLLKIYNSLDATEDTIELIRDKQLFLCNEYSALSSTLGAEAKKFSDYKDLILLNHVYKDTMSRLKKTTEFKVQNLILLKLISDKKLKEPNENHISK